MALRVSSEEDVGGGAASDEGIHVVKPADKKKAGLGVVNEEASIVLGDSDDDGNCLTCNACRLSLDNLVC